MNVQKVIATIPQSTISKTTQQVRPKPALTVSQIEALHKKGIPPFKLFDIVFKENYDISPEVYNYINKLSEEEGARIQQRTDRFKAMGWWG